MSLYKTSYWSPTCFMGDLCFGQERSAKAPLCPADFTLHYTVVVDGLTRQFHPEYCNPVRLSSVVAHPLGSMHPYLTLVDVLAVLRCAGHSSSQALCSAHLCFQLAVGYRCRIHLLGLHTACRRYYCVSLENRAGWLASGLIATSMKAWSALALSSSPRCRQNRYHDDCVARFLEGLGQTGYPFARCAVGSLVDRILDSHCVGIGVCREEADCHIVVATVSSTLL